MANPLQDRDGLPLSTPSAEAAELYGASIDIMLDLNDGARET
jgi:hypothetical protein